MTGKLIPNKFFTLHIKKEVIISHVASTQLGLLQVLYYERTMQCRQLPFVRIHTPQCKNICITTAVCPFQDYNTTIQQPFPPLQDHTTIHSIEDLKDVFAASFNNIGNMPGKYSIILDPIMSNQYNTLLCNPKFIYKNNQYFNLSSIYFLYPLTSLPKMVKQEMPASIKQS